MASLVFIIDMEEGHLIPSIGLAHELRSAGHDITYISVIDNEKYITQQGFRYYPIFEKSFPAGSNLKIKNQLRLKGYKSTDAPMNSYFEELIHYDFQWILRDLKPDLIIMSWVLCLEALILYYTWRINPVMLSPILMPGKRNTMNDCLDTLMDVSGDKAVRLIESITKLGYRFKSLLDFVNPSASFDEVIHCPRELKIETNEIRKNVYHLGPSIFRRPNSNNMEWKHKIGKGDKVVYACLGSQSIIYGRTKDRCFEVFIKLMGMREMAGWHLVLSTCSEQDTIDCSMVPENVTVVKWAPQTEVLESADVAIIHGGLGTIKECIYYRVPMIVLPFARDQPENAKRIEYHRLGIAHDPETVPAEKLAASIHAITKNGEIKSGLERMGKIFYDGDESNSIVNVIEEILKKRNINLSRPV